MFAAFGDCAMQIVNLNRVETTGLQQATTGAGEKIEISAIEPFARRIGNEILRLDLRLESDFQLQ